METIEVTAQFDSQGNITPLSFTWDKVTYRIESTGRRWEAKDILHILVMTTGDQVFHLTYNREIGIWNILLNQIRPKSSTQGV